MPEGRVIGKQACHRLYLAEPQGQLCADEGEGAVLVDGRMPRGRDGARDHVDPVVPGDEMVVTELVVDHECRQQRRAQSHRQTRAH